MNKTLKKIACVVFLIFTILSCGISKDFNGTKVNAYANSDYAKSVKSYSGTLNKTEYDELIPILERELKTTFPVNKSILINYNQKAPNCINTRFNYAENKQVAKNRIRISSRMSSDYGAVDFFVYTQDSFHDDIYEKMPEFILDTGFFYENVFTEHENCAGFLIIKPNGEFYKHYGEDYYSEVKAFLEKNKKAHSQRL